MGGLGAREMSYGSDLDLVFVYDEESSEDPDLARQTVVKLAQQLIRGITLNLEEGPLYAVDIRLRPSGNQGPLVSSAQGFLRYHRQRAMLWEQQALLRSRAVAGNIDFGRFLLRSLADVRYPESLERGAHTEIDRLRTRMLLEAARERGSLVNIKQGRGALVDVEFIVEYLQLRFAHACPALRVPGTRAGLQALENETILSPPSLRTLKEAYEFLRRLENRLCMVYGRSAGEIELQGRSLEMLARRMGYGSGEKAGERLRQQYNHHTQKVRRIYERVVVKGLKK